MKKEKILMLQELLVTQMNHWILVLVPVTILGVIDAKRPVLWKWALCSMVPFLFSIVRRYSNHFLVFLISHVLPLAVLMMLPFEDWIEKAALVLMVTGYAVYSFYLRIKTEERLDEGMPPAVAVGIAGIGLLLQHYQGIAEWESYYVPPIIIFLGVYFVELYLEQYIHFMIVNESSKGRMPEKQMFRSGISMVIVFAVVVMIILLLTSDLGWAGDIASALKMLLIWLLKLLPKGEKETAQVEVVEQEMAAKGDMGLIQAEDTEPSVIWLVLEKVVIVLACVLLIAICLAAIYALVRFLYDRFKQTLDKEAEELDEVNDVREKCEVEHFRKERKPIFEFLSTRERIRRMYKKEVWAARMQLVKDGSPAFLKRLTPKECGESMQREELARVYEKARYSQEECTAGDIKRAKEK